MILKFKTKFIEAGEGAWYSKAFEPDINSTKEYKIVLYEDMVDENVDEPTYVHIKVINEEDVAAFRKYVGYIEDVE
tara:strand:+ start:1231 stop:1458 length:228 start_codon:yes stop_codon:yes gene_type:complete